MKTRDFDYDLPQELIAQLPIEPRDASRLLVLDRSTGEVAHHRFTDVADFLRSGDILVANDSRVFPARLFGQKATGGQVELLLLEKLADCRWVALVGGKRLRVGVKIWLCEKDRSRSDLVATIESDLGGSRREIHFSSPVEARLVDLGHTPLPPYIHARLEDPDRYQTVYAHATGSAAAPTAGLHFTGELLLSLRERGVDFETCTLHVGLDTFQPVVTANVSDHTIHSERAVLTTDAARRVNQAKLAGGRIVAVGTTTARVLETAALRSAGLTGSLRDISRRDALGETTETCPWKPVAAFSGATDLYIYPGYRFRAVDVLLTNFHLPESSLIMMVSAFADRDMLLAAYRTAVKERYRFYSFGDAMLVL